VLQDTLASSWLQPDCQPLLGLMARRRGLCVFLIVYVLGKAALALPVTVAAQCTQLVAPLMMVPMLTAVPHCTLLYCLAHYCTALCFYVLTVLYCLVLFVLFVLFS